MKFTSDIIAGASGSIGGSTWSHNRGGQYIRKRAIPTNPSTTRQVARRADFTGAVTSWRMLTELQREAWRTFAANTPQTDALGQTIYYTGQQAFIKAHTVWMLAGMGPVTAAPTIFDNGPGVLPIEPGNFERSAGPPVAYNLDVSFPAVPGVAGTCILQVGQPQNLTRRFYNGPYQLAGLATFVLSVDTASFNLEVGTTWLADIQPAVGVNLPYRLRCAYADGRISPPTRGFIVVA